MLWAGERTPVGERGSEGALRESAGAFGGEGGELFEERLEELFRVSDSLKWIVRTWGEEGEREEEGRGDEGKDAAVAPTSSALQGTIHAQSTLYYSVNYK